MSAATVQLLVPIVNVLQGFSNDLVVVTSDGHASFISARSPTEV